MNDSDFKRVTSTRRQIMQTSAKAVATGAMMVSPAMLPAAPNTKKLGLAVIGCGGRGTGAAHNALSADSNIALTAVGDLFEENVDRSLAELQKRHPKKVHPDSVSRYVGFHSFKEVVNRPDVDAVILATPPAFRPQHLEAATVADKHSFVEITTAIDAPGVRSVLKSSELAHQKGLAIVSGFCWRYDNGLRAAQKKIQEGAIGEVRAIYANYLRPNLGSKYKQGRATGMSNLEWQIRDWYKHLWLSGDVTILLSGGHSVDKMAWYFNDEMPLAAVATGGQTFENWGNTFDHAFVVYEYANGRRGFLGCRSQSGCFNEVGEHVIGSKGIFRFTGRIPVIEGETNWKFEGPTGNKYQNEHDQWIASIRAGNPINDGKRMAESTLMAMMGRMAAYTGQRVTWEQALNSEQELVPQHLDWGKAVNDVPLAVPGQSKVP